MNKVKSKDDVAVWALTPNGAGLAAQIAANMEAVDVYLSRSLESESEAVSLEDARFFSRLSESLTSAFHRYGGHVFISSTGIAVRLTAPLLRGKTIDPAVVVVDDRGRLVGQRRCTPAQQVPGLGCRGGDDEEVLRSPAGSHARQHGRRQHGNR